MKCMLEKHEELVLPVTRKHHTHFPKLYTVYSEKGRLDKFHFFILLTTCEWLSFIL